MPTDDERRRIAAKLRANAGTEYIEVEPLCEAIGCDARRGSGEGIVWNRLADLIEPSCDRDALLALADEFDEQAEAIARYIESSDGDFDCHAIDAMEEQYGYARRIREAVGVAE